MQIIQQLVVTNAVRSKTIALPFHAGVDSYAKVVVQLRNLGELFEKYLRDCVVYNIAVFFKNLIFWNFLKENTKETNSFLIFLFFFNK